MIVTLKKIEARHDDFAQPAAQTIAPTLSGIGRLWASALAFLRLVRAG